MKKSILLIVLAALLLSFVSYESSTAVAGETKAIDSALVFGYPDATVRMVLEKYKTQYSKIPYFTKFANGKYLFYVVQGNWKEPKNDSFPKGGFKMGIIDEKGNVLLPIEYDKLYNPDGTVYGFIEIEKNGKRGLFNYSTKEMIAAHYDVIYRNRVNKLAIAIGRKGDKFCFIQDAKLAIEITNENDIPRYSRNLEMWGFDVQKQKVNLYSTVMLNWYYEIYAGNGVYFMPSFMYELRCFPEVSYLVGDKKIADELKSKAPDSTRNMGDINMVGKFNGSIQEFREQRNGVFAYLLSFYKEGVNGRSYFYDKKYLMTIDQHDKIISKSFVSDFSRSLEGFCMDAPGYCRFLNDTLLESKKNDWSYSDTGKICRFDEMPVYTYFAIQKDGTINQCVSNRVFNFTKWVKIDSNYLSGCYVEYSPANYQVVNHLEIRDLDFMIQEIYADYGLIFTDKKWVDYFATQTWYKPRYNTVDSLLTNIDKQNLIFIKKKKVEMGLQELKQLEKETGLKSPR